jgi:hypothetical protein
MKVAIKEFFIGFLYTFSNDKRGNSARKTTAFALMLCVAWIHYKYIDRGNAINALWIDLLFVALMLGIVTAANLIEAYLGRKMKSNPTEDETKTP